MQSSVKRAAFAALFVAASAAATAQTAGDNTPVLKLEPFTVVGSSNKGYSSTTLTSATRTNTALVDIPQTITVINDLFLHDIGAFTLDEALAYAPGVKFRAWSGGEVVLRGFESTVNYKNQTRLPGGYSPDFANVERIEVVKGPASAVSGRGSAGGLLNFITKKPQFGKEQLTTTVTVGSDAFKRGMLDYNLPVPGRDDLAVRVITQVTDSDHWRQGETVHSFSFFPSLRWKLSEVTELLLEGEYTEGTKPNDFGMPYNTLDKKWTSFDYTNSEPFAKRHDKVYGFWATLTHQFRPWLNLRQVVSAVDMQLDQDMVWVDSINRAVAGNPQFAVGDIFFKRTLQEGKTNPRGLVAQGDALLTFDVPAIKMTNKTLISYEWARNKSTALRYDYTLSDISLSRPVYGVPASNPRFVSNSATSEDIFSYLISHQSGFFWDRVLLSAGWRRDSTDGVERTNRATNTRAQDPKSSVNHPRYGIVLKPLPHVSVYGIYSKNAEPTRSVLRFGSIAFDDPRQSSMIVTQDSELHEAGIKAELFKGNVIATVAFFKLQRFGGTITTAFGPAQNDPLTAGLNETIVTPADETRGVEFELTGTLFTPRLTVLASYQKIDSERFLNNHLVEFRGLPAWTGSLFLNYDFGKNRRDGFQVRGGMVLQGDQQGDNDNTYKIGSDPRFDLGAGYAHGDWSYSFSLNNITDAIVPTQFQAFRANSVLPPRQIRFAIERSW